MVFRNMTISCYLFLCILRILLTILPEIGYIHPDEFFQGPEIVYGEVLELKAFKTWEFQSLEPIRNIVFPYFITGVPAVFVELSGIKYFLKGKSDFPYLLIVLPRLIMCCFSFIIDVLIYKMCALLKQNHVKCLIMYSSSYVTLTYLTRTFSNSLEVLFFALLVFFVFKLLKLINNTDVIYLTDLDIRACCNTSFVIGVVFAIGVFNRPTFISFSLFPIFSLLFCLRRYKYNITKFYFILSFCMGAFSSALCFCFLDTLYYQKVHYSEVNLNIFRLYQSTIITPLNFIFYNINSKNLKDHGLHAWYTHVLINIPLLFSVNGVLLILKTMKNINLTIQNLSYIIRGSKNFLFLSFVFPLCLLSFIPHQEPRFIIPLLFPLVLLGQDNFVKKKYCIVWYTFNALCFLFYGIFHQGGIYLSTTSLHNTLQTHHNSCVIFYKTYMPPRFLLGLTADENTFISDFAGVDEKQFKSSIKRVINENYSNIFIIIPFEALHLFDESLIFSTSYKLSNHNYIFPHLSTETPPSLNEVELLLNSKMPFLQNIERVKQMFSIHILLFKHS